MKLLAFQHIECEHPGIFRALLDDAEIQWDAVELDAGERIPDFGAYDALWVMGGPMDVWEEEKHPWLCNEKILIKDNDYYYSNPIARASKTMFECKNAKTNLKSTGTEG